MDFVSILAFLNCLHHLPPIYTPLSTLQGMRKKAAALRHKCRNNEVFSVATNSADFARISFAPSRPEVCPHWMRAWPGQGVAAKDRLLTRQTN